MESAIISTALRLFRMKTNTKKSDTKYICLIGGPGVGKSTIAAGLFYELKAARVSCELVTEVAKDYVWEETPKLLENQIHVFAEQYRRQWRLLDKVEYVITDSPLILNSIYFDYYLTMLGDSSKFTKPYIALSRRFFDETFLQFNNVNFFIKRSVDYEGEGRNQSAAEAVNIDQQILEKLLARKQDFVVYSGDTRDTVQSILSTIIKK